MATPTYQGFHRKNSGAMAGTTYIQRVATQGGVAPAMPCAQTNMGARQVVKYQADYIFYKAQ